MGEVKFGELKGVDRNGNKYFENTEYPFGQHRWVEYKVRPVALCVWQTSLKYLRRRRATLT